MSAPAADPPLAGVALLLIVDNATFNLLINDFLTQAGATVVCVNGLQDGLNAVQSNEFQCVLCDIRLHDGDGRSLASALTASHSHLPIIGLSGFGFNHRQQQKLLREGFAAYFNTPLDVTDLLDSIQALTSGDTPTQLAWRNRCRA